MSMESTLQTLLSAQCPRTFPDVAPSATAKPFVTWQGIGGESVSFLDNTAGDKRSTLMQISVWSATRLESLTLIRSIEAALRASSLFIARPQGEPVSMHEQDTNLYGSIQRFEIIAAR